MRNLTLLFVLLCLAFISDALSCPFGWTVTDYGCKSEAVYGRGTGYPWKFGDGLNLKAAKKRCNNAHPELGCEKNGELYYPKCRAGFTNQLCCICLFDSHTKQLEGYKLYGSIPDVKKGEDIKIQPI